MYVLMNVVRMYAQDDRVSVFNYVITWHSHPFQVEYY